MDITKILKTILQNDKLKMYSASETRLLFALMGLYQERANEKGQFVATLDEVCKRYGTTCKTHLLKIREALSKKGIIKCSTTQSKSSTYTFIVGNNFSTTDSNKISTTDSNKNSTTDSNKISTTDSNKNSTTDSNKISTTDSNKISTTDSNNFSTTQGNKNSTIESNKNSTSSSSTPTTQESKIFEASTPFGKIQYHTEAAAKNAPIFCKNAMDLFCTKATLKEIQKFCLYWLKEDEITKQPLHQTKQNFSLSDEFKQFQEKQRSNM